MEKRLFENEWGGRTLSVEIGRFAQAANGTCLVKYGETVVLATATMSPDAREGMNWFPLTVDFEEKLYAAGRIKGSRFIKKEGRPTDEAILAGRYVDRAIRPLFDDRLRNDIQVITTVLSFDGENDADVIALIAASCALHMSDIPWEGPIANVRVGQINDEWVLNPTYQAREKSLIDLAFAGTPEKILMVEAGAKEAPDDVVLEAFRFGMKHLRKPLELIEEVRQAVGKPKVDPLSVSTDGEAQRKERQIRVEELARPFILKEIQTDFFAAPKATKTERRDAKKALEKKVETFLLEQGVDTDDVPYGKAMVEPTLEHEISRMIVEEGKRVDGRTLDEIRTLVVEVGIFERLHGSAHFMRGETQVLSMLTLGAPGDEQTMDGMELTGTKRFMHHYNFPPFSVGETKPLRGPGRREIGHGALAEKALEPVIPSK